MCVCISVVCVRISVVCVRISVFVCVCVVLMCCVCVLLHGICDSKKSRTQSCNTIKLSKYFLQSKKQLHVCTVAYCTDFM